MLEMFKVLYWKARAFADEERGSISVQGIAITVGAIIVIGFITILLTTTGSSPISGWITQVWTALWGKVSDLITGFTSGP